MKRRMTSWLPIGLVLAAACESERASPVAPAAATSIDSVLESAVAVALLDAFERAVYSVRAAERTH